MTCIRVCPYWQHFGITREGGKRDDAPEQYRQALRHAVGSGGCANGHLIEEHDLRANIFRADSRPDHLDDYGMMAIGRNLADRLWPVVMLSARATQH